MPSVSRHDDVPLPVLRKDRSRGAPPVARSRMGRRRALVLLLVHLVIGAHVLHWLFTGMTLSPVEPSEAMQTLELGRVNAGFVLFALALLSTAVLGRFFCGWACHVVALQDLCAWLMRRVRIHPKPFRSRLLVLAPLGLGVYMFVWPSLKRGVLKPLLAWAGVAWPGFLAEVPPLANLHNEFLVEDFWATFPAWYVAIPFLAVCGFAAVYFLGSKGFCTYGCPYGGFFAPLDRLAPVRIRVSDACEQCGHCTAVCTSNVRVHEEVRDFGMVVDPGCMKCMDCVSVCPNDALHLGIGRPGVLKRAKSEAARETAARAAASRERRYDLTPREEWAVGALWLALFLAYRNMLGIVPMLMAAGLAGIASFAGWKLWRLVRDPSVRAQNVQLKLKGRWRSAGVVFALATGIAISLAGWSGAVRSLRWTALQTAGTLAVPIDAALRPEYAPGPEAAERARRAARSLHATDSPRVGGLGWALEADELVDLAYLHVVRRDWQRAEHALRRAIEIGRPLHPLVLQLGRVMEARGAGKEDVLDMLRHAIERHPHLHAVRTVVARALAGGGRRDDAIALWEEVLRDEPVRAPALVEAARSFAGIDRERALELARRALDRSASDPEAQMGAVEVLVSLGATRSAARLGATTDRVRAARIHARTGDAARARELLSGLLAGEAGAGPLTRGAELAFELGMADLAESLLIRAEGLAGIGAWDRLGLGNLAARLGTRWGRPALVARAEAILRELAEDHPREPLFHHDLALLLLSRGDADGALSAMERAAQAGTGSAVLASRAAQLARRLGETERAEAWRAEAERRSGG